jgi:hypothetical protein
MADAAAMRNWLRNDTSYAVAVVWHGRLPLRAALHLLITTALAIAERAGIAGNIARIVAVNGFKDAMAESERRYDHVLRRMVDAALGELLRGKARRIHAANAAADIARAEQTPTHLIESAMRIAEWRLRQRFSRSPLHG